LPLELSFDLSAYLKRKLALSAMQDYFREVKVTKYSKKVGSKSLEGSKKTIKISTSKVNSAWLSEKSSDSRE
jgi:hypothetical protein